MQGSSTLASKSDKMAKKVIKIGTRGSPLALAQARIVVRHLEQLAIKCEIIPITTSGDRIQDRKLTNIGGKALFTKEIEEALLQADIDIAVHSMKDVETTLPDSLTITCILEREDVRDACITSNGHTLKTLPSGATLGTSSARRAAQALALRPDLKVIPFRGNIDTRLRKLQEGLADATFLAMAGLKRLHKEAIVVEILDAATFIPAAGQGAIGLECRHNDELIMALCQKINHPPSFRCVMTERALLAGLQGSCDTPVGAYATETEEIITLSSIVTTLDGKDAYKETIRGSWPGILDQAQLLGEMYWRWLLTKNRDQRSEVI
jgi:hydroxymethylbilane synthase